MTRQSVCAGVLAVAAAGGAVVAQANGAGWFAGMFLGLGCVAGWLCVGLTDGGRQ